MTDKITRTRSGRPKYMLAKYDGWSAKTRMDEAVRMVDEGKTQSEAARLCGVSRSALNKRIREKAAIAENLAERSAEARAARNVPAAVPGVDKVLDSPFINETRRVPPLVEFNELYFSGLPCGDCGDMVHETPDFHKEIMGMMDDPSIKRLLVNLPPFHAKSTVGTVRATLYDITCDPNVREAVITKSQTLAKKFLYQLRNFLENPESYRYSPRNLIEDWGPFFDGSNQATQTMLYVAGRNSVEKDPTIEAFGIGSQIYGNRWDKARLDDAFDMANSKNPDLVEFYVDWITGEVESRVGKSGSVYIIGTRVNPEDAYSKLQALPGYHVIRYPAIIDEIDGLTLWQDHFNIDDAKLKRSTMSPDKWQLLYQNSDTLGSNASFTPEMMEKAHDPSRHLGQYSSNWIGVIGLDPALVLMAVDPETGRRHLVDIVNASQMKAPQLMDQLYFWAEQYYGMLRELRVESNGLQSQLIQYNQEVNARYAQKGIRIVPHITTKHNKWDPTFGVESMAPMFFNGQITLPWGDINTRAKIKELEEQLIRFPLGQTTDLYMALWFAELGCRDIYERSKLPMFSERFKAPPRILRRRKVVDFGRGARVPTEEELAGAPSGYVVRRPPDPRRYVNIGGE